MIGHKSFKTYPVSGFFLVKGRVKPSTTTGSNLPQNSPCLAPVLNEWVGAAPRWTNAIVHIPPPFLSHE